MSKGRADAHPKYLTTKEAARIVGLFPRTLEKHRTYGTGPRYSTRPWRRCRLISTATIPL